MQNIINFKTISLALLAIAFVALFFLSVQPQNAGTSAFAVQIAHGDGDGDGDIQSLCVPGVPPSAQTLRLSATQFDNTLRDLLGVTELSTEGGARPSTFLGAAGTDYQTAATATAAEVMSTPELKAYFLSCDEAVEGCLSNTIVEFGRFAFRLDHFGNKGEGIGVEAFDGSPVQRLASEKQGLAQS